MKLFRNTFEYKSMFLDPVDWRPREHNTAADHVANCVLAGQSNVDIVSEAETLELLSESIRLQICTDGGFVHGVGAAHRSCF